MALKISHLKFLVALTSMMFLVAPTVYSTDHRIPIDVERLKQLRADGWPLFHHHIFGIERVSVINMIPQAQSDETGQDSEPNLAVDPTNTRNIVGTAFTQNPTGSTTSAPIYVSTDGGNIWAMRNIVPSGNGMTGDISVDFAREDNTLYTGILRGGSFLRQMVLRSPNPISGGMMAILTDHNTESLDQPYVSATTFDDSGTNRDRVYVGFNEWDNRSSAGGTGRTASAEFSLDARTAAAPAGFTTSRIEARNTNEQDMPAVRFAVHNSGVVYGVFYRWTNGNTPNAICDVTVVRDDNFASGANPFTALVDPSDNVAGRLVVTGRTVPAFPASLGANRLVASNLSIAVSPSNPAEVYIAWADRVGINDYTLHVRRSTDSGTNWSADLITITNATNPALAITTGSVVGFLYQQLTGTAPNQRWETHIRRSANSGTDWSDIILADTPDNTPAPTFQPYIGDYLDLITVGKTFYGIFSASNTPNLANFPQGVTYQRNVNFTTQQLRDVTNTTNVNASIDPFFFKISPPRIYDICKIWPKKCDIPLLDWGRIVVEFDEPPFRFNDPIPKNCLVKWSCPGCDGTALCPPYYHIFIDNVSLKNWDVQIFGKHGEYVKQEINPYKNGIVLSFRPNKKYYIDKKIGNYTIGFESINKLAKGKYTFKTTLETSDYPFRQHMKMRGKNRPFEMQSRKLQIDP